MRYDPLEIESKWQGKWDEHHCFEVPNDINELKKKPKYYVLGMFPYPSGAGLHVGHPEGYTATDVLARLKRMQGHWVLHPMGWDAFGLPAERAAVRENIHPAIITKRNVDNFRGQIKRLGFAYDWTRELSTTDPDYYKWTQWIFLKLYAKGLAYLAEVPVNWCPALGTVLANEEVKDGKYVETGDPVEKRSMKQWMLKITAYAERLIEDLDDVNWPESVKEMQRNWIGKSTGADITFKVQDTDESFTVFSTRHDTLFGATYCVLAPEHPLVEKITTGEQCSTVQDYVQTAKNKSDLARTDLAKEKTGAFTGAYAVHPFTQKPIPIWIADYVLISYGTGAIMAVPGHDERDHEFARKFELPIVQVIDGAKKPIEEEVHLGVGKLANSEFLDGLEVEAAKQKMADELEKLGCGKSRVQYRLRDWLFSRQRYWGEPFPLVHTDNGETITVDESDLPVELPPVYAYKPTEDGDPPLGRASSDWLNVTLPDGRTARRETNTMPQWAGSCWYYLRYMDPKNSEQAWDKELENYWMPVDMYIGGVEHAVLHLLYARFWHKVLYDCGLVSTKEPFRRLFNQGMILAHSYRDEQGKYYSPEDVTQEGETYIAKSTGNKLKTQIEKMSKSKLNVVNPDDVIEQYGADSMRLYELFMGPLEATKPWQMAGVDGVSRFLQRTWRLVIDEQSGKVSTKLTDAPADSEPELNKSLHKSIKKVLDDTEGMRFNTAISQMMSFVNDATASKTLPKDILRSFLKLLSPYAPHIAEELWERIGESGFVSLETAPTFDPKLVVDDTITVVVQVNGKRRDSLSVARGLPKDELEKLAMAAPNVQKHVSGAPKRVIVVPDKLVNVVV